MNTSQRTFRAPTPRAALDIVKAVMGPEAVILSTREVKNGLFQKAEIEITAMLPDGQMASAENAMAPPAGTAQDEPPMGRRRGFASYAQDGAAGMAPPVASQMRPAQHAMPAVQSEPQRMRAPRGFADMPATLGANTEGLATREQAAAAARRALGRGPMAGLVPSAAPAPAPVMAGRRTPEPGFMTAESFFDDLADSAGPAATRAAQDAMAHMNISPAEKAAMGAALTGESMDMSGMTGMAGMAPPRQYQTPRPEAVEARAETGLAQTPRPIETPKPVISGPNLADEMNALIQHLISRGVEPRIAEDVVHEAVEASNGVPSPQNAARVREGLMRRLHHIEAPWLQQDKRVVAVVGPTGVGKTTTIAKMATRALMESDLKVALITVDTYRIGASDQLARYGEIMAAPTYVARNEDELLSAVERSRDADLVLVDTAGRSDDASIMRQARLLRQVPDMELLVAISAASGWQEVRAAAGKYRSLNPQGYIVTKVDEAAGPGSLFSIGFNRRQPLTCITDGQSVPEDLHAVLAESLVSRVIGSMNTRRPSL